MPKFLIIDDESDLVIGSCNEIIGFSGSATEDGHYLKVVDLTITESFLEYCMNTKKRISGIDIQMQSGGDTAIGSYFFGLEKPMAFHSRIVQSKIDELDLIGCFPSPPSAEAWKIWEQWMISKPSRLHTWSSLPFKQRLGWLEVVRIHSEFSDRIDAADKKHFVLDVSYVTDITSFYCALGEAMNGPGGYYGFNLDSLEDCLCGGFGAVPPFQLHFINGSLRNSMEKGNFSQAQRTRLKRIMELLASQQVEMIEE